MMSRLGIEAMISRLGVGRFGPRSSSDWRCSFHRRLEQILYSTAGW